MSENSTHAAAIHPKQLNMFNLLERLGTQGTNQMGKVLAPSGIFLVAQKIHVVQNAVRGELHFCSLQARSIEVFQLGLALVVFVHVVALEGHTGVRLVHMHCELCSI